MGLNLSSEYDCNVYLIESKGKYLMIDTGSGINYELILHEIKNDGIYFEDIHYIFVTHGHADHSGGAYFFHKEFGAKVICSMKTSRILENADEKAISLDIARNQKVYPLDYQFNGCSIYQAFEDNDKLEFGDLTIHMIATPGHSYDMMSCYVPELRTLFSGDSIFANGKIAMIPSKDFSLQQLKSSIYKLSKLEIEKLFPGHYTPVLRNGNLAIKQALEKFNHFAIPDSIV